MNRNHSFVRLRRKGKYNLNKNDNQEKNIKSQENKYQDINNVNQINEYYTKKAYMDNYNSVNNNPLYSKYNRINSTCKHSSSKMDLKHENNKLDNNILDNNNINNNYQTEKLNPKLRPSKSALFSKSSKHDSHKSENIDENGDYYLCQNCINERLIEEKRKRDELNSRNNNNNIYEDKNRYYNENRIKERLNQRERNINEAYHTLEKCQKINAKDKLIKENENAINPLYQQHHNYKYENFRTKYAQKQQYIKDNYNKFINNERPEITKYFSNYINNPNYKPKEYGEYKPKIIDIENYKKDLNEQINYKINKKRKEKEEDKYNENKEYLSLQKKIEKENEEKALKKQKIKEELIKGNLDIINAKKDKKEKIYEEDMKKYKEYYEKENQEYNDKLLKEKCKKNKINREFITENQKNLNRIRRDKEQQKIENNNYRYNDYSYEPIKEPTDKCYACKKIYPRKLLTRNSNIFGYKTKSKNN